MQDLRHKNNLEKIGIEARETILDRNDINNEMNKMYELMRSFLI